jgi:hypothetical protein
MTNYKPLVIINGEVQEIPAGNTLDAKGGVVLVDNEYSSLYANTFKFTETIHSTTFTTTKDNATVMLIYRGFLTIKQPTGVALNFNIDYTPVFQNPQWGGANYWQTNSGACVTLIALVQVPTAGEHLLDVVWASADFVNYIFCGENAMGYALDTNRGNSRLTVIEY